MKGKLNIVRNYFWKNVSINFSCVYSHKRDVYANKSTKSLCTKYIFIKRWKREKPPNYYKENGQKPQEYAQNYYWNLSQDKGVERKE